MFDIKSFFDGFIDIILRMSIFDLIDISIVAYIFYKIFMFIKDTRAEQVLKGIVFLLLATQLSSTFKLHTLYWLLVNTLQIGLLSAIIIFQPELRAGLEHIGRTQFNFFVKGNNTNEDLNKTIEEIIEALYSLSRQKIGALIIIERKTKISDIISTTTKSKGCNSAICRLPIALTALRVIIYKITLRISNTCLLYTSAALPGPRRPHDTWFPSYHPAAYAGYCQNA